MNHPNHYAHLYQRAQALKLYGLLTHWEEVKEAPWLADLLHWEETQRTDRGLKRRLASAHIGRFKPLAQFDWSWPKQCDRQAIEELLSLEFLAAATNVIFCGPNGVGKSTIASNIAYQAVLKGQTALFTTAGQMLNDLSAQDGQSAPSSSYPALF